MDRMAFLTAAYAAVWIISFIYIFLLMKRNRQLQKRLGDLEQLVETLQKKQGSGEQHE